MLKYIWLWLSLSYYEEITGSIQKILDQLRGKAVSLRIEKIPPEREEAEAFAGKLQKKGGAAAFDGLAGVVFPAL